MFCRIYGNVQMVGFREFVRGHASALEIVGYAKNTHNGSVEICAIGDVSNLQLLVERLHEGPERAHVLRVDAEWGKPQGRFDSFEIRL